MLSNIDELFEREELSAAPDPGWPDCFNSGVFVFSPSKETYEKLLAFCGENGSFDGERDPSVFWSWLVAIRRLVLMCESHHGSLIWQQLVTCRIIKIQT